MALAENYELYGFKWPQLAVPSRPGLVDHSAKEDQSVEFGA
jgi:hypothetical protein